MRTELEAEQGSQPGAEATRSGPIGRALISLGHAACMPGHVAVLEVADAEARAALLDLLCDRIDRVRAPLRIDERSAPRSSPDSIDAGLNQADGLDAMCARAHEDQRPIVIVVDHADELPSTRLAEILACATRGEGRAAVVLAAPDRAPLLDVLRAAGGSVDLVRLDPLEVGGAEPAITHDPAASRPAVRPSPASARPPAAPGVRVRRSPPSPAGPAVSRYGMRAARRPAEAPGRAVPRLIAEAPRPRLPRWIALASWGVGAVALVVFAVQLSWMAFAVWSLLDAGDEAGVAPRAAAAPRKERPLRRAEPPAAGPVSPGREDGGASTPIEVMREESGALAPIESVRDAFALITSDAAPAAQARAARFLRAHGPDPEGYELLAALDVRRAANPEEAVALLQARSRARAVLCEAWAGDPRGEAPERLGCPGTGAATN